VFDDEDTRVLYESLPDLRSLVPAVLLGDGPKPDEEESSPDAEASNNKQLDMLLLRLSSCVSRDLCDEFSLSFCYLNSKVCPFSLPLSPFPLCPSHIRTYKQPRPHNCTNPLSLKFSLSLSHTHTHTHTHT
jgi:hypothetical protein